ncbi:MAG: rhomboid family intramembrane serine protease [Planctomycetota bacterium]
MPFQRNEPDEVREPDEILTPSGRAQRPHDQTDALRRFLLSLYERQPRASLTRGLIAINVAVFAVMVFTGADPLRPGVDDLRTWGASYGPAFVGGEWWRALTAPFIHAGIVHLLLNMWILHQVGQLTERLYGRVDFALVYLAAGISGVAASTTWNPVITSVGASGAIFGLIGAEYIALRLHGPDIPPLLRRETGRRLLIFLGLNLFLGMTMPMIDNAAHIGGFCGGIVAGALLLGGRPTLGSEHRTRLRAAVVALAAIIVLSIPHLLPADLDRHTTTMAETVERLRSLDERYRALASRYNADELAAQRAAALLETELIPELEAVLAQLERSDPPSPLLARRRERLQALARELLEDMRHAHELTGAGPPADADGPDTTGDD